MLIQKCWIRRLYAQAERLPDLPFDAAPEPRLHRADFINKLQIKFLHESPGRVRLSMPCVPDHTEGNGQMHEGALAALLDIAGTSASWSLVQRQGSRGATIGMQLSFLNPTREPVLADAHIQQRSEELFFSTVQIISQTTGQLVAMGSQKKLAPELIPHLVSRVVYTGSAGFDETAQNVEFMLSPRVRFLRRVKSSGSQNNRAIFSTRQEPLSNSQYGRLHLLCGEGVRYDTAEYLRFGVTALLVNLIDFGVRFADSIELEPLRAINIVARDLSCRESIGLLNGVPASAIDVQRHYLSQVQAHVGRPYLPEWAEPLCNRWQATLDSLETDPMQLVGILDWPTKLGLYRAFVEQRGFDWQQLTQEARKSDREIRAELYEFDVRFGDISEDGLFASITRDTNSANELVSERTVDDALHTPPQGTRARLRGEWIERLSKDSSNMQCDWSSIYDNQEKSSLLFDDPFLSGDVGWS